VQTTTADRTNKNTLQIGENFQLLRELLTKKNFTNRRKLDFLNMNNSKMHFEAAVSSRVCHSRDIFEGIK
jgi:hypothetical protein